MRKILCLLLGLLVLSAAAFAVAEETEPAIYLSCDSDTYRAGDTVQITYEISGGAQPYRDVRAEVTTHKILEKFPPMSVEDESQVYVNRELAVDGASGVITLEAEGYYNQLNLWVTDAEGKQGYAYISFRCFDDAPVQIPVTVLLQYKETSVAIGETLTADYIIGSDAVSEVRTFWEYMMFGGTLGFTETEYNAGNTGSTAITPEYGDAVRLRMSFYYQNDYYDLIFAPIPVTGSDIEQIEAVVRADTETAVAGDIVNFHYEISKGFGNYEVVRYQLIYNRYDDYNGHYGDWIDLPTDASGDIQIEFEPGWYRCWIDMQVRDDHGLWMWGNADSSMVFAKELSVSFAPDKNSYSPGETASVDFEISGGAEPFQYIETYWQVSGYYGDGEYSVDINGRLNQTSWDAPQGADSLLLEGYNSISFTVSAMDANGTTINDSYYIPLMTMGNSDLPFTYDIGFSGQSVNANETLTATYSIAGDIERVSYRWINLVGTSYYHYDSTLYPLDGLSGSVNYSSDTGDAVRLDLAVTDSRGVNYVIHCPRIPLTGASIRSVSVDLNTESTVILPGQTFTVDYAITGGTGRYEDVYYYFSYNDLDYNWGQTGYVGVYQSSGAVSILFEDNWRSGELVFIVSDSDPDLSSSAYLSFKRDFQVEEPLTLSLSVDRESYHPGDPVTVSYSVTGGLPPYNYSLDWRGEQRFDTAGANYTIRPVNLYHYETLNEPEGTFTLTDTEGMNGINLTLIASDYTGENKTASLALTADAESYSAAPFNISIEMDKTSVAKGETITARFSVSGAEFIQYAWISTSGSDNYPIGNMVYIEGGSGTASFAPEKGDGAALVLMAMGGPRTGYTSYTIQSSTVPLTDAGDYVPLQATLQALQSVTQPGRTISARYAIQGGIPNGEGLYTVTCYAQYIPAEEAGVSNAWITDDFYRYVYRLPAGEGTVEAVVPENAAKVRFLMRVASQDGLIKNVYSEPIDIGDEPITLTVSFYNPESDAARVGAPVEVSYSVGGGSGQYRNIRLTVAPQGENRRASYALSGSEGTVTYLPVVEGYTDFILSAEDSEGAAKTYTAELNVGVGSVSTLSLPARLTAVSREMLAGTAARQVIIPEGCRSIEAHAFAGSGALRIVVPDSVTEIDADAFAGCDADLLLDCREGSGAASFAAAHGIAYTQSGD
ncbi:MAG: hypothetical protein IJ157_05175 [Clostridia bacterium]|nr:hypothetical protein [Clostridia bacterium]